MGNSFALNTAILGVATVGSFILGAYSSNNNLLANCSLFKCSSPCKKTVQVKESAKLAPAAELIGDEEDEEDEEEDDEDGYEVDSTSLNDIPGEVKMVFVIRQDLQMTKGKVAAQCCHAAVACYRLIATDPTRASYNLPMTQRWLYNGQAKITLKCPDEETMDILYAKSISMGVNSYVVHDAGRTQIASGSATVLGLGPAPKALLDQITGDLKLY